MRSAFSGAAASSSGDDSSDAQATASAQKHSSRTALEHFQFRVFVGIFVGAQQAAPQLGTMSTLNSKMLDSVSVNAKEVDRK